MERFVDDDAGYLRWVAQNPDGYVLNTYRQPAASYLKLHRATCGTINDRPARGDNWTVDYQKVCGDRAELELWARNQVDGELQPCPICRA
jgi:hypothetical protein